MMLKSPQRDYNGQMQKVMGGGHHMNKSRPINVNPLSIRLPVMAFVSILHRMSGILVFLLIPILLSSLQRSLASPEGLAQVKDLWQTPLFNLLIWSLFAGIVFHLFAGVRHLLMDLHIGDSLCAGRWGARFVLVSSFLVVLATYWFWG